MSNNKNTPPLRFPEFSGEWEEAIIDDFFTILYWAINAIQ